MISFGGVYICRSDLLCASHSGTAQRGVTTAGDADCLGHRPIVDGVAQAFVWQSYNTVNERALAFGSGLVNLGLIPVIDNMRMVALYLKNCPDWVICEQVSTRSHGVL